MAIGEPSFPSADITSAALNTFDSTPVESPTGASAPVAAPTSTTSSIPFSRSVQAQTPQTPEAAASTQVDDAGQPINPEARYTVVTKVNGVESTETITGKEMLARSMNHRAFTQNQQALRAEQRALHQERQGIQELRAQAQRAQEQEAILNDAGRLAVYIQNKFPHMSVGQAQAAAMQVQQHQQQQQQAYAPPVPQIDPQALANYGDVEAAVQRRVAEFQAEFGRNATAAEAAAIQRVEERASAIATETVAKTIANLQNAHAVAGYDRQIDQHIGNLLQEHPVLGLVPELNDLLRYRVSQMNLQTPEALFAGISEAANAIAEGFDAHYNMQRTAAVAAKAKLVTHGMATPSGVTATAPTPEASRPFAPGGKGDWKSLSAQVGNAFDAYRSH